MFNDTSPRSSFQSWLYARARAAGAPPQITPQASAEAPSDEPRYSFRYFAQKTFWKPLDAWQLDLCDRLESVTRSKGRRVLIHSMPQVGKTVLVSQRFPAYALGENPLLRVKLLMYNVTHAKNKGGLICKNLIQSETFRKLYPDPGLTVPRLSRSEEWSTAARSAIGDGQASYKCFGLETGATGEGGDLWIIDDPYPSAAHADSKNYNDSVWSTWEDTIKPRLGQDSNVVIMFHRYQVLDLAGRLLEQEQGEWELWRYAAIADGDYAVEGTEQVFPCYPPSRPAGQPLSPRFPFSWYESKQKSGRVWRGQFQGRPTEDDGQFFDVSIWRQPGMIIDEDQLPPDLPTVRAWDFAATDDDGAYSAGIKMCGPCDQGFYYVVDSARAQKATEGRMKMIGNLARADGDDVEVGIPQDPGSAGKDTVYFSAQELAGFRWWSYPARQDKVIRAEPYKASVNIGQVKLVRGSWNAAYIEELRQFPFGAYKDQVDASADAFKRLARKKTRKRPRSTSQSMFT